MYIYIIVCATFPRDATNLPRDIPSDATNLPRDIPSEAERDEHSISCDGGSYGGRTMSKFCPALILKHIDSKSFFFTIKT